jgi:glycosyltransferase involved in cell wall biosynthesis
VKCALTLPTSNARLGIAWPLILANEMLSRPFAAKSKVIYAGTKPDKVLNRVALPTDGSGNAKRTKLGHSRSDQTHRPRRWTINGDFVALNATGVARYASEVTRAIDVLIGEGHPLTAGLKLDIIVPREAHDLQVSHIPVRVLAEFRSPRLPQFWVQAQLPRHVEGGLVSFCNLAPVAARRHIACIHDLHTRLMPESYGFGFRMAHRFILPLVGRRAMTITTVSELSRGDLIAFGVAPAQKVAVTYNGSDHTRRWDASRSTLEFGRFRPFVLCLGRSQKYKNGELIWRIAKHLDALGLDICMAGDTDAKTLSSFGAAKPPNVHLLGRISDDDFAAALGKAACFLFPSRIEGFGLPAVEAMALGCPVVASTSPCLPEVCGDAALYAGPDDPEAWVQAITSLASASDLRHELVRKGYARAASYSWRSIAEFYLQLMSRIDQHDSALGSC